MDDITKMIPISLKDLSPKQADFLASFQPDSAIEKYNLEKMSAEDIFNENELKIFNELDSNTKINDCSPFKEHTFLILKATRICNLRCTYCHSWREGKGNTMPIDILIKTIRDILSSSDVKQIDFIWHGGEVTLLSTEYIKKAIWLQKHYKQKGQIISNSIQTNATNLTSDWLHLLKTYDFEVGISIDGPEEIHDKYRVKKNGEGSFHSVRAGIEKLRENEIPFGALAVINEDVIEFGAKNYIEFLIGLDLKGVALLNAIPETYRPKDKESYLPWLSFVDFLSDMFKIWWPDYRDVISIRELNGLVENTLKKRPTICEFAGDCMGQFLTIEPNGVVSACDKYIGDSTHQFGNLNDQNLTDLIRNSVNLKTAVFKANLGIEKMPKCEFFAICKGGCPHDVQLNIQNSEGWNGECCGMKALMSEISSSVNNEKHLTKTIGN